MRTFVVRVFVPAAAERLPLTGIVESVGTGRALAFQGPGALVDALLAELELTRPGEDAREEEER